MRSCCGNNIYTLIKESRAREQRRNSHHGFASMLPESERVPDLESEEESDDE